jgi:hypothetical protein
MTGWIHRPPLLFPFSIFRSLHVPASLIGGLLGLAVVQLISLSDSAKETLSSGKIDPPSPLSLFSISLSRPFFLPFTPLSLLYLPHTHTYTAQ